MRMRPAAEAPPTAEPSPDSTRPSFSIVSTSGYDADVGTSLSSRVISAAHWRFASSAIQGVVQLGVGILLARRLPPADFGVIALATVAIGFATLAADLGLGPAVIKQQPLTSRHLRTAFTVSLLVGSGLALALFASAGALAHALHAATLGPVLRVQASLFVISAFGGTALALLRRSLQFRRLFLIDFGSYVLGYAGVAVGLAYAGFGVWSLVGGAMVQRLLASVSAVLCARHPLTPLIARTELRDLLGFGLGVSLNQLVNYVARNGDNVVAGRGLGVTALGLYARAFNLMAVPLGYVDNVMWSVLFPSLSQVQRDPLRFRRGYLLSVQVVTLVTVPLVAALAVAARPLVLTLYGERWAETILPLQILCCAGPFRAVYNVAGAMTHAAGRVYAELVRQIGFTILVLAGSWAGLRYGISGVAAGVAVAILVMYLWMGQLSIRISGCSLREFLAVQVPGWLLGLGVGICGALVQLGLEATGMPTAGVLAGVMVICAALMPVGLYLLPAHARPIELFARLGHAADDLPPFLRNGVLRVLRISA
jgi:O-antigen/teichoic acid export membrane protein